LGLKEGQKESKRQQVAEGKRRIDGYEGNERKKTHNRRGMG